MISLNKEDFYFGALLTTLLSVNYKTALIDGDSKDKRIYNFSSDSDDFIAYLKYCVSPIERDNSTSWIFAFSKDEIDYIFSKICSDINIRLVLLCGQRDLKGSSVVIIGADEIADTIFKSYKDKNSLTVYKRKNAHNFRISRGGSRDNDLTIPSNRVDKI